MSSEFISTNENVLGVNYTTIQTHVANTVELDLAEMSRRAKFALCVFTKIQKKIKREERLRVYLDANLATYENCIEKLDILHLYSTTHLVAVTHISLFI